METLEAACDTVAFAIDDVEGKIETEALDMMIEEALTPINYDREAFDEMFQNIYLCDVATYALNASSDAKWAAAHDVMDIDEDFEDITAEEADALGLETVSDNESL